MAEIRFTTNQKGAKSCIFKDFSYNLHRVGDGKIIWRCRDRKCHGRIHTVDNDVIHESDHSHPPSKLAVISFEAQAAIKKRALDSHDQPRQIYQDATSALPIQVSSKLPSYNAIQRKVERVRKAAGTDLKTPASLAEIQTDRYLRSNRGERFLLFDTGSDDSDRIIAFAADANLLELYRSDTWLGDGTFKVAPSLFFQLYSVHGIIGSKTFPLVYALLLNKQRRTYSRLFENLRQKILELPDCRLIL